MIFCNCLVYVIVYIHTKTDNKFLDSKAIIIHKQ